MKKRILAYLKYLSELKPEELSQEELAKVKEDMLIQIGFFQHERLIHLIVTVLFAWLTVFVIALILILEEMTICILAGLLIILLVPYIKHYYLLENGVQKMYKYYDEVQKCIK